jgi:single-strand DNA-binding protein
VASDLNHVVILGNLVRDGELKYTSGGTALLKFGVANNQAKKVGEQWEDEVFFFNCLMWGKRAESLNQYLVKGARVVVEGQLRQNRWTTQEGQNRSVVEIKVNNLNFAGGKKGEGQSQQSQQSQQDGPPSAVPSSLEGDFEDDIPF